MRCMNKVTQEQIARAAGVNKATVSRALSGAPCIPPKTAAAIKAAARRLGYRPDPVMAAIAASRWHGRTHHKTITFGYISQFHHPASGMDRTNWAGAEARADELGCRLDHLVLEDYRDSSALQRTLTARGLTGLIIGSFYEATPTLTLNWAKFCAVSIGITPHQPPLHAVAQDAFDGALLAWRQVRAFGYPRPGMVIASHESKIHAEDDDNRRAAALVLHASCKSSDSVPPLIYNMTDPYDIKVRRLRTWHKRWKPDAVIGFNAETQFRLTDDVGIRVPEQVGYAQLIVLPEYNTAGIKEAADEIGAAAVDLLQFTLRTNQWGLPKTRIRHYLEPQWLDGPTLPPRMRAN